MGFSEDLIQTVDDAFVQIQPMKFDVLRIEICVKINKTF